MAVEQPERSNNSDLPETPRFFYLVISLAALAAMLFVIVILSSNQRPQQAIRPKSPPQETTRMQELRDALSDDPGNAQLNLEMGNLLFDAGNFRESIGYYKRVLDSDPVDIAARIDLGVSYFNLGMIDSALVEMRKSLEIEPDHVKGLFNIGVIYYNMGENKLAQKYWQKLISRHSGSQEAQIARQMLENIKT